MFKSFFVYFCVCFIINTLAISEESSVEKKSIDDAESIIVTAASQSLDPNFDSNNDDSVVSRRSKRQFPGGYGTDSACLTSRGSLGRCLAFKQCYPFFKLPVLSQYENWILSMQDTCAYVASSGQQQVGVCCNGGGGYYHTNEIPYYPPAGVYPNPDAEPIPQFSHNPYVPANWPPPIPTHPPDHTIPPLPTHPPSPGYPNLDQTTTKKPAPAWPPTVPAYPTTTTKKPSPAWPPQITNKPTWTKPTVSKPWPPPVPTHPTTWPSTTPPDVEDVPSNMSECGIKNGYQDQERIVGGHNAEPGEWPWMAAILTSGRLFCGGSLIDDIHILTAAHCVAQMNPWDVARLRVNLGDYNIKSKGDVQHVERKVRKVVRHRGFDPRTLYNDIALLTLDSPVPFSRNIRPICLPQGRTQYHGRMATVIGWGSLKEMGPTPGILQEVSIPIWTNQECKTKYAGAAPGGIVETFLCAGKASKDSCSGDSGGPLMINDGKWQQIGVVSWGIGCGKGQYPGVYTRITSFMSWINKNLDT
ncbi:proclotting enzyme-like [Planococcus citri]|uniref:proclotting enzyme-like n=1 Tax=Planococcus citri TaxID=170843 RepID=UPI0031F9D24A